MLVSGTLVADVVNLTLLVGMVVVLYYALDHLVDEFMKAMKVMMITEITEHEKVRVLHTLMMDSLKAIEKSKKVPKKKQRGAKRESR